MADFDSEEEAGVSVFFLRILLAGVGVGASIVGRDSALAVLDFLLFGADVADNAL